MWLLAVRESARVGERAVEQLKQQIARDFNMKVTVSRTEVGGIGAECWKVERVSSELSSPKLLRKKKVVTVKIETAPLPMVVGQFPE